MTATRASEAEVPAVSLADVRKTYHLGKPVHALDGVSLSVPRGSFTAVMGPSGSGKSTLMNLVGLLDTPTEGSLRVDGHDVAELSDRERTGLRGEQVGFVFQTFNLMPRLSAVENVALPLVFRGWSRSARTSRARELLDQVGLGDRADHRPSELSGGQRQRVAIARALATDPAILLADEPTGNLDTETGEEIMTLFEDLYAVGHTILLVTHEPHIAEHADRVVHLLYGRIDRVEAAPGAGGAGDRQVETGDFEAKRGDPGGAEDRGPEGGPDGGTPSPEVGPIGRTERTAGARTDGTTDGRASNTTDGTANDGTDGTSPVGVRSGRLAEAVESVRLSWRSIRDHALRSALTTLGVVIGVAAVITFVTLGASLQAAVIGDITGIAAPEMNVYASPAAGGSPGGGSSVPVFTEHDLAQMRNDSQVAAVVPSGTAGVSALTYRNRTVAWQGATATTPGAFADRTFASGRPFTQGDPEVVVNEPAARLFEPNVSVGDRVAVRMGSGRTVNATVVGVLNTSAETGPFGGETPPQVYVPTDPFYETTVESPTTGAEQRAYPAVTVRATDFDAVPAVQERVEAYLDERSDARRLAPDSYELVVQTNEELVDQIRDVLNRFTGFITGIAVISLVVGSIGIANIMLVSVTERTREIGIMKAVGAQKREILQLFLVEAVILGIGGAVVGTAVGILGGYLATVYVDVPLVFAPEWVAIAVAVGIVVGVVAGLYPAWNAARVDPIEALRYE